MTVYVLDKSHPDGGYICNEDEVPSGLKTISMAEFDKKNSTQKAKNEEG